MLRKLKTLIAVIFLVLSYPNLHAQYVNADSLIQLPGHEYLLSVNEFSELIEELNVDELEPLQEMLYGQFVPVGNILSNFVLPSDGKVISRYGMRSGRMHTGTDIKMPKGDTIYAAYHGVVTMAKYFYGYGNMILLDHGSSIETGYAHLSAFLVKTGDTVLRNQPIGLAGSTGRSTTSHLHFELKESGKFYNPELVYDFNEGRVKDEVYDIYTVADLKKDKRQKEILVTGKVPLKYIVANGDSLWKISRKFNTSVASLCQLNNLDENSVLNVGMELKLFQ